MIMWRSIAAPLVHKMQKSWLEQGLEKHIETHAKQVETILQRGTQGKPLRAQSASDPTREVPDALSTTAARPPRAQKWRQN